MSEILSEYQQARAAAEAAIARLDALQADPKLKKYQDFEKKLRSLMADFGMSLVDINILIDPTYKPAKVKAEAATTKPTKAARNKNKSNGLSPNDPDRKRPYRKRTTKTYTNPHDGTKIHYIGGVHKELNEWREKWGKEVVDSWGVKNRPE